MKCLFFICGCLLAFSCSDNKISQESPDYGLLILQKRIDSLEQRVDSLLAEMQKWEMKSR
jgi:hypothetical protein